MLNRATIYGRLTADPELRHTTSNIPVCSFSIACEKNYKNSQGDKETDFFNIVAWRNKAEIVSKYFAKGAPIITDGSLQTRKYEDRDGKPRVTTEILADNIYFGESKKSNDQAQNNNSSPNHNKSSKYAGNNAPNKQFVPNFNAVDPDDYEYFDDDLPF